MSTSLKRNVLAVALSVGGLLGVAPGAQAALVANYTFDNASLPFADSAGGDNNGTAFGSAARVTSPIAIGAGAISTNIGGPATDYVSLANESTFDFGGDFTIAMYARPTNISGGAGSNRTLIEKGTQYRLRHNTSNLQFFLNGTSISATATGAVAANVWKHYAVTVEIINNDAGPVANDARISFYVNGAAFGSPTIVADQTALLNNDLPRLGLRTFNSDSFQGYMDEVRLYNTALSASQVATLVPEPTTFSLAAVGLIGLTGRRRSRRA